jgi:hypothetical protein
VNAGAQRGIDAAHTAPDLHHVTLTRQDLRAADGCVIAKQLGGHDQLRVVNLANDADFIVLHGASYGIS